jgi:hypothetical protein
MTFCMRTDRSVPVDSITRLIRLVDPESRVDPEKNPITFWVTTILTEKQLMAIPGVEDVVVANKQEPSNVHYDNHAM